MKLRGILAALMGLGLVAAAILIHKEVCYPAELILGWIVLGVVSGLMVATIVEKLSTFYVFFIVVALGLYVYFVVTETSIGSSAVGMGLGVVYGVSLYLGWLGKSARKKAA